MGKLADAVAAEQAPKGVICTAPDRGVTLSAPLFVGDRAREGW